MTDMSCPTPDEDYARFDASRELVGLTCVQCGEYHPDQEMYYLTKFKCWICSVCRDVLLKR